jgi:ketosteroid isomerase-like protein
MVDDGKQPSREAAVAFVGGYGRGWQSWDIDGLTDLFGEEVVYVAHATEETVRGRDALAVYFEKEAGEQGEVDVRMGDPVIEGDRVAAEFWVKAAYGDEPTTIPGCFIARLDADGRCVDFREYWFDSAGHIDAFEGWGK